MLCPVKHILSLAFLGAVAVACSSEKAPPATPTTSANAHANAPIYKFEEKDIDGKTVRLDTYAGKVLLVVNVASKCGYTPQYEGLEKLYEKHQAEGFEVLGFPCDQFGNQEPGKEAEIKSFCMTRYSVKFPLFSKIEVNGPNTNALYSYLRKEQPGTFSKEDDAELYAHLEKTKPETLKDDSIKWNFTKFLVDRDGKVVKRFESNITPEKLEPEVAALLAKK